jgi:pimeloyl-ACP methyl ester carboxylesterase
VEGKGFPVLMLHGTGVNLHEWDPLAERLRGRYQIIRVDWPPYGLSGPNPKGYTTPEAARLVGLVLDQLGVQKVAVVATSNGSNVALQLNADKPERIAAMAFSILPLERPSQTRKVDWRIRQMLAFHEAVLPEYHPLYYYQLVFDDTGHPGWKVPAFLPQMMYDMSNLPGAIRNQKAYLAANVKLFKTKDVGAIAAKVTAPVLLQWCERDTVISQGPEASVARFTHTRVKLVRYPDVGHWPMWEIPDRFAADVGGFLDGVLPKPAH